MSISPPHAGLRSPNRRRRFQTVAVPGTLVFLVTLLAVALAARSGLLEAKHTPPTAATPVSETAPALKPALFHGWNGAPDLALVLSAQMHGYLNPCGCSKPQYGGLPRRYNFMQELRSKGWPVVGMDLGDLLDLPEKRQLQAQTLLKYETAMKALDKMGYAAVAVGKLETEMPLITTLGVFALNNATPAVLAANVQNRVTNFPGMLEAQVVRSAAGSSVKVGVVGMIGQDVQKTVPQQNPALTFADSRDTLNDGLKELDKEKAELKVLLYQGPIKPAMACAKEFPQFNIILCLTEDPEPAAKPERVGDTLVIGVGHKGRYVGVVGAYKTGNAPKPFDLKYQLVQLGEEYDTKPGQPANPAMQLLEAYAKEVKDKNLLSQYPRAKHPVQLAYPQATYVGSAACAGCHRHAFNIWQNHPHSKAYPTLTTAKNPSNREFDGECVECHVIGFHYDSGFQNAAKSPNLMEVGCENCHGPGSIHANLGKKTPPALLALMNPYKPQPNEPPAQTKARLLQIDISCQKCHDIDNDVHWDFATKWQKVVHHTPKAGAAPAPAKN